MLPAPPLVLTLRLDPAALGRLDGLRREHYPADRNLVPAHVTLFHALPGDQEPAVREVLAAVGTDWPPLPVRFPAVRFLGNGVAVAVDSPDLLRLRGWLAAAWAGWLTPQDRQGYRPHATIQNKVPPTDARRLYERLAASWEPFEGTADGLQLWRYLGGPWEPAGEFAFDGTASS